MATVTEKAKEAFPNEDLGEAILSVYATSRGDPEVARLMDAVIDMGTATKAQKHSFAKLLKRAKKNAAKRETDLADSSVNKTRQNSATAQASSPTPNASNPQEIRSIALRRLLLRMSTTPRTTNLFWMPHISREEMRKFSAASRMPRRTAHRRRAHDRADERLAPVSLRSCRKHC